jgi:hypothetical protein
VTAKATKATKSPTRLEAGTEAEFRRWTPQEVVDNRLLPYTSVRVLKQKCYRREVHHHLDGRRISFTPDDLRRENARTAVVPIAA